MMVGSATRVSFPARTNSFPSAGRSILKLSCRGSLIFLSEGGPWVCIGSSFAMLEAALVLVTIIQRFQLSIEPGTQVDPWTTLVLCPKNGIMLMVEERYG